MSFYNKVIKIFRTPRKPTLLLLICWQTCYFLLESMNPPLKLSPMNNPFGSSFWLVLHAYRRRWKHLVIWFRFPDWCILLDSIICVRVRVLFGIQTVHPSIFFSFTLSAILFRCWYDELGLGPYGFVNELVQS